MGPIRTGFSSLGTHSVETAFERGAAYGFDFVESTMNDYDRGLLADEAAAIRSLAADADLDVVVHLPFGRDDLAVGSSDDDARATSLAALKACVRAAGDVGAEKGVLHVEASSDAPHLLETDGIAELVTTLVELDGFARERGVELCAENMLRRPPRLPDLAVLLGRPNLSLTLDTGHARANGRDTGRSRRSSRSTPPTSPMSTSTTPGGPPTSTAPSAPETTTSRACSTPFPTTGRGGSRSKSAPKTTSTSRSASGNSTNCSEPAKSRCERSGPRGR
jgi:hypothetical protein